MKQIGRRLSDVTTPCDQNSRHVLEHCEANFASQMAVLLGGRDFNLVKHVFLKGPDLFQPD
jgi:hypothetical protein